MTPVTMISTRPVRQARHVRLDTLTNVRDLGGYKARAGQTIKWGRLYRADCLGYASGPELATLADLGLRTIIDLRTVREMRAVPLTSFPGRVVDVHRFPLLHETWAERRLAPAPGQDEVAFLTARYVDMLIEGAPAIVDALDVLAQPAAYPLLFHCALGKDRTGVLAAVVLALLGVDDETIAEDYALSPSADGGVADAWGAPPEAMRRVLAHVRTRCGSMVGFARGIGVPFDVIEELHRQLLE